MGFSSIRMFIPSLDLIICPVGSSISEKRDRLPRWHLLANRARLRRVVMVPNEDGVTKLPFRIVLDHHAHTSSTYVTSQVIGWILLHAME
jgi:hypothetical protein